MPSHRRCWAWVPIVLVAGAAQAAPSLRFDGEAAIGHDDNVLNAPKGEDTLITPFYSARLAADATQIVAAPLVIGARLQIEGEEYRDVDRLSNAKGTGLVRLTYRPDGAFGSPAFTLWGSASDWRFRSDLRDSHEVRGGLRVDQALTTRVGLRAEVKAIRRMADNRVFDDDAQSAAIAADWRVHEQVGLRLGYEFVSGEMVTTARARAIPVEIREATRRDDLYDGNGIAYRIQAHTQIATAGLNWRFAPRWALDFETRGAWADAKWGVDYERVRGTVSLLARF
ncbi:MAG TPA: hypothetical protein VJM11_17285 [Nevskiaceae bacterium]|nr:hypothetical protein [Nevskiaceae bacterium]